MMLRSDADAAGAPVPSGGGVEWKEPPPPECPLRILPVAQPSIRSDEERTHAEAEFKARPGPSRTGPGTIDIRSGLRRSAQTGRRTQRAGISGGSQASSGTRAGAAAQAPRTRLLEHVRSQTRLASNATRLELTRRARPEPAPNRRFRALIAGLVRSDQRVVRTTQ